MTDQQREFEKIAENTAFQILEYQLIQVDIEKLLLQRLNEAYAKGRQSVLNKVNEDKAFIKINELYYEYGRETISRITAKELCNEFYMWVISKLSEDKEVIK